MTKLNIWHLIIFFVCWRNDWTHFLNSCGFLSFCQKSLGYTPNMWETVLRGSAGSKLVSDVQDVMWNGSLCTVKQVNVSIMMWRWFSLAETKKLSRVDGKVAGAKYKITFEEKLLEATKTGVEIRLSEGQWPFKIQPELQWKAIDHSIFMYEYWSSQSQNLNLKQNL